MAGIPDVSPDILNFKYTVIATTPVIGKFKTSIGDTIITIDGVRTSIGRVADEIGNFEKSVSKTTPILDGLGDAIDTLTSQVIAAGERLANIQVSSNRRDGSGRSGSVGRFRNRHGGNNDRSNTDDQKLDSIQDRISSSPMINGAREYLGPLIMQASEFESAMSRTAISIGMTGDETKKLIKYMGMLSLPSGTNQSMDELRAGFDSLNTAGLNKWDAVNLLAPIGRAATANQIPMEKFSDTAVTIRNALNVAPSEMKDALSQLSYAAQNGSVHLETLLEVFPDLGGAAADMGMTGLDAVNSLGAALETVAEKTSPQDAARGMAAFMESMGRSDVQEKFAASGINVKEVMTKAQADGQSPMDAILEATKTQGIAPDEIGAMFSDQKAGQFLTTLLGQMEEYRNLKTSMSSKTNNVDSVRQVFDALFKEIGEAMDGVLGWLFGGEKENSAKPSDDAEKVLTPKPSNSNVPAANSNRPQPGSAIAAAEAKGTAQSANGGGGSAVHAGGRNDAHAGVGGSGAQQIELTLVLPSGVGITVNKPNPNVQITARTGDLMRTVS